MPPISGKFAEDLINQGIADDSFKQAYSQAAENDRAKKQRDAALAQLIKGKQLDNGNEMAKLDKQAAISGQEYDRVKNDVQDAAGRGIKLNAKMGNAAFGQSESDPALQMGRMTAGEGKAWNQIVDKKFSPIKGQLEAWENIHNAINNPNSVNDEQLKTSLARLSEGQGQRLLQSVIEHSGISKTGAGAATDVYNYVHGGGLSRLQAGQKQAILDSLNQHRDMLHQQYDDAQHQLGAIAPTVAPHLDGASTANVVNAYAGPLGETFKRLTPAQKAAAVAADRQVQQQALPEQKSITNLWGLLGKRPPSTEQAPPSTPNTGTPSLDAIQAEIQRRRSQGR